MAISSGSSPDPLWFRVYHVAWVLCQVASNHLSDAIEDAWGSVIRALRGNRAAR